MHVKFRAACLQLPARPLDRADENLRAAENMVREARARRAELIVLPECTYPGYYLSGWDELRRARRLPTPADALEFFAELARRESVHICVGLVEDVGTRRYNSVFMLSPSGEILGRNRKLFLWHFDERWFDRGDVLETVEALGTSFGMFVCADGRLPEIPRTLALKGARVFLDSTNWVATGFDREALTNPQPRFMMQARAVENGAWVLAANKVGMEAGSVVFCGLSIIVSPAGEVVARAPALEPAVIVAEVTVTDAPPLLRARRPEAYPLWAAPAGAVDRGAPGQVYLGLAQVSGSDLHRCLRLFTEQGADIAVVPGDDRARAQEASRSFRGVLVMGHETRAWAFMDGKLLGAQGLVHGGKERGFRLIETPVGRLGLLPGRDGLFPEAARQLALLGADLIIWTTGEERFHASLYPTRAAENRVFLASCARPPGPTAVYNPDGALLAAAFPGEDQVILARLDLPLAEHKELVPGTDVVRDRTPELYLP